MSYFKFDYVYYGYPDLSLNHLAIKLIFSSYVMCELPVCQTDPVCDNNYLNAHQSQ